MNDATTHQPSAAEVTDLRDALFWSAVAVTARSSESDYHYDGVRPGHAAWVEAKLRDDIHYQLRLAPGLFEALVDASTLEDREVCRLFYRRAKLPHGTIQVERERVFSELPPAIWSEGLPFPGVASHVSPLAISRPPGWRPGWPPGATGHVPPLPERRSYEPRLTHDKREQSAMSTEPNDAFGERVALKVCLLESVVQTSRSTEPKTAPFHWLAQLVKRLWSRGMWG